jgi:hypothetical protein
MTTRPLTVIPLKFTGLPITQLEKKININFFLGFFGHHVHPVYISYILLFQKSSNIFVKRQHCQFLNNEKPDRLGSTQVVNFLLDQIKTPIYLAQLSKEMANGNL